MEMALKCFEWRRDFHPGGVTNITEEQVEGEAAKGVGYFHGFARNGRDLVQLQSQQFTDKSTS